MADTTSTGGADRLFTPMDELKLTGANGVHGPDHTNGVNSVIPRKPVPANGKALATTGKRRKANTPQRQGYLKWLLSVAIRLFTWYSIFAIIFRCPPTQEELTEDSPRVCKPYFQIKNALTPHVSPYYEKYAASYAESAKPYYNTLDKHVYTPTKFYAAKYGAPRVQQAQAIGEAQWEKQVQPQLTKLNSLYKQQYDKYLAAHVNKASEVAGPYYKFASDNARQTFYASILPTYEVLKPHGLKAFEFGRHHTVNTVYPHAKVASGHVYNLIERNILPKIRILYGEHVEPQLLRISERLGRYRDGKKIKAVVAGVDSSASASSRTSSPSSKQSTVIARTTTTSTISSVLAKSTSTTTSTVSDAHETVAPAKTPLTEAEQHDHAQKVVADDLKIWQQKFSKATDEGSKELETRIAEITERAIEKQARTVGKAHLIRLEETVASEIKALKKSILSIVKLKYSNDDIDRAVRKAGLSIRDKAQAVRDWRQKYDNEVNDLVAKAAEDTFQIIDHIRDLGLQEIGMRWAWIDGITHKDWVKYHQLKNKFDEWRQEVEEIATQHPGLNKSRRESEDIESGAMDVAEEVAKELARVKETGKWKLQTGDTSDDWTTKYMSAAAHGAAQKVADVASDASAKVMGTGQGTVESVTSVAAESAASAASVVSENANNYADKASKSAASAAASLSARIAGASTQRAINSAIIAAQASASSLAAQASASVIGTSRGTMESIPSMASVNAESLASVGSMSARRVASEVSASVAPSNQGSVESMASVAKASASSLVVKLSQGTVESIASIAKETAAAYVPPVPAGAQKVMNDAKDAASSVSSAASSVASSSASSVASSVAAHPSVSSVSSQAASAASSVSSKASSATSSVSKSVKPSVSSASKAAASSVSGASKVASSSSPILSKKLSSSASSFSTEAAASASSLSDRASSSISSATTTHPTVKPVWGGAMAQHVEERKIIYEDVVDDDIVENDESYSEKIQHMANEAGNRFHDITKAVSEALLAQEPTATVQQGAAESVSSKQYVAALSAASAALYGTTSTQGTGESIVSIASENYANAVRAASAVIHGTPTPAARASYDQAILQAREQYNNALSVVSARISGTQVKPVHEDMFSSVQSGYSSALAAASSRYASAVSGTPTGYLESLSSRASIAAYGTPTGALESISAIASSRLSEGIAMASSQLSAAKGAVGVSPTPTSQKFLDNAKLRYYATVGMAHDRYSEFVNSASAAVMPTATTSAFRSLPPKGDGCFSTASGPGAVESAYSRAQEQYANAVNIAQSNLDAALNLGKKNKEPVGYAEQAQASYSSVLLEASKSLGSASRGASTAIYGTSTGAVESAMSQVRAQYSAAAAAAQCNLDAALSLGKKNKAPTGYAEQAQASYSSALSAASSATEAASRDASVRVYGAQPTGAAAVAASASYLSSVASENWEALITKASLQVYGQPTPWSESLYSQAAEYGAAATGVAGSQYVAMQALINDLVAGREAVFTESVMSRFSSAYYTPVGVAVSSASSMASSVSSVVASAGGEVFTPPPAIEHILEAAQSHMYDAVDAASVHIYGISKTPAEKAKESASSVYSSVSSEASVRMYGSETGYVEAASSSISAAASSAQAAILAAVYGEETSTVTPIYDQATSAVGETYAKITDAVLPHDEHTGAKEGSVQSAQARLGEAVESARSKLAAFASMAGEGAEDVIAKASEGIEDFASSISLAVTSEESTEVKGGVKVKKGPDGVGNDGPNDSEFRDEL